MINALGKLCLFKKITKQGDSKSYCRLIHGQEIRMTNTFFLSVLGGFSIPFRNPQIFIECQNILHHGPLVLGWFEFSL